MMKKKEKKSEFRWKYTVRTKYTLGYKNDVKYKKKNAASIDLWSQSISRKDSKPEQLRKLSTTAKKIEFEVLFAV